MNRFLSWFFAVFLFLSFSCESEAGFKIYYLRHAEGGHNVVNDWKDVPKEKWPVYVGNENMFTPKGEAQAAAVPAKLEKYHFDFIAVSPMWRTRNTILPYLKAKGLQGEIWPELHECPGAQMIGSSTLPPPSASILNAGPEITLPADEAAYFRLREDGKMEYRLAANEPQLSADLQLVLHQTMERLLKRFGGTDKSVLLVGHGNHGRALLQLLVPHDLPPGPTPIRNAGVWMVEQQPDGSFRLEMLNDEPYVKQ